MSPTAVPPRHLGQDDEVRRPVIVLSMVLLSLAVFAGGAALLSRWSASRGDDVRLRMATHPVPQNPRAGEIVEPIDEETAATIFAFRALGSTGLMDLDGRAYLHTYDDDTFEVPGGWRVGFEAAECDPTTCESVSHLGGSGADTFVEVQRRDGLWTVVHVAGEMRPLERESVIGYSLPDRREPSHFEFYGFSTRGANDFGVQMVPLWVGPYPTTSPGSVCKIQPIDRRDRPAGQVTVFYQPAPTRSLDTGGGVHGRPVDADPAAVSVTVSCRQYTGPGWELAAPPRFQGGEDFIVAVEADLVWRGDKRFVTPARCEVTLLDEDADPVYRAEARLEDLWPPPNPKDWPHRTKIVISTRDVPEDVESIGRLACAVI